MRTLFPSFVLRSYSGELFLYNASLLSSLVTFIVVPKELNYIAPIGGTLRSRVVSTSQNMYDKLILPQNPKAVVKISNIKYNYESNLESNYSIVAKTHALYAQLSNQIKSSAGYFWHDLETYILMNAWLNNNNFLHQSQYLN